MFIDLELYSDVFHEKLQESTRAFYADEARARVASLSAENAVAGYLKKAEARLKEEQERCSKGLKSYIDVISQESLQGIVIDEFIRKHISTLLSKGNP